MSKLDHKTSDRVSEEQTDSSNVVPYKVGYGRPPAEHRFKKGQSGNPKGRVKGSTNKPKVNMSHGMRAAEGFLRHEAYRPVTLREGGELIELPAIQAVFRAMGVSAMKGNRFAQKTLAELITGLEEREAQDRMELFGNAVEYKHSWTAEIERCERTNQPLPEPIPHPHDIILDPSTGGVQFNGPQTLEQKQIMDEALARRDEAQQEVNYAADKYKRARSETIKQQWLEEWHWEQRMFDILNDIVPSRYKADLGNRSRRPGASRQGKAIEELRRDRELRVQYVGD